VGRKFKKVKDLRSLDPKSSEYWNKMLAKEGLTMLQGLNPKLSYVGSNTQVEDIKSQRDVNAMIGGKRVKPKGYGPDKEGA
jgi:hypothetical protein